MGKNLKMQIMEEISRREEERLKSKKKISEEERKNEKQRILKTFEDELFSLRLKREDYKNHKLPDSNGMRKYARSIAYELGFSVEMVYSKEEKRHLFIFSELKLEDGQGTWVQDRLAKFREHLEWQKQYRKKEIEKECLRLLCEIKEGKYEYICLDEMNKFIYIRTEEEQLDEFDLNVILKFFMEKYQLLFKKFEDGKLYFAL